MVATPGWSKAWQHAGVHQLRGGFAMLPAAAMHPVLAITAADALSVPVILENRESSVQTAHTYSTHTCCLRHLRMTLYNLGIKRKCAFRAFQDLDFNL